jgi:hypothetical protein
VCMVCSPSASRDNLTVLAREHPGRRCPIVGMSGSCHAPLSQRPGRRSWRLLARALSGLSHVPWALCASTRFCISLISCSTALRYRGPRILCRSFAHVYGECVAPPASQDTMTGLGMSLLLKRTRGHGTLGLYVLAFGPIAWGEPLEYLLTADFVGYTYCIDSTHPLPPRPARAPRQTERSPGTRGLGGHRHLRVRHRWTVFEQFAGARGDF